MIGHPCSPLTAISCESLLIYLKNIFMLKHLIITVGFIAVFMLISRLFGSRKLQNKRSLIRAVK